MGNLLNPQAFVPSSRNSDEITTTTSCAAAVSTPPAARRKFATPADAYYAKHGTIPPPATVHATLPLPTSKKHNQNDTQDNTILVVGDVHGCLHEFQALLAKARRQVFQNPNHNKNNEKTTPAKDFDAVILVGDLVNKGPHSIAVLREVQHRYGSYYFAVRGNHDDGALKNALQVKEHAKWLELQERKEEDMYAWIVTGEAVPVPEPEPEPEPRQGVDEQDVHNDKADQEEDKGERLFLSDEDVSFLAELPYTLTIPWMKVAASNHDGTKEINLQEEKQTVQIVHAGLIPNLPLEDQTTGTMVTLRDVCAVSLDQNEDTPDSPACITKFVDARNAAQSTSNSQAWAEAWQGPSYLIFGHDAKRGLQQSRHALGLDTGACYGKELSGVILPAGELISVKSKRVYAPIVEKKNAVATS